MAGLATSGTLTHWFRDHAARELDPANAFATLAGEAAASPPGARGLVMLPYFSGERTPIHDPEAKGMIFGLNLTHDRGDLYRALLEGIAFGANHIFETYREIGEPPKKLLAVGGGTKNPVWSQATSDISGMAQTLCATPSAPATATRSWQHLPSATCAKEISTTGIPSTGGSRHGSGIAPSTKSSTVCSRSFIREPGI